MKSLFNTIILWLLVVALGVNIFLWVTYPPGVVAMPLQRAVAHLAVLVACVAGIGSILESRLLIGSSQRVFPRIF